MSASLQTLGNWKTSRPALPTVLIPMTIAKDGGVTQLVLLYSDGRVYGVIEYPNPVQVPVQYQRYLNIIYVFPRWTNYYVKFDLDAWTPTRVDYSGTFILENGTTSWTRVAADKLLAVDLINNRYHWMNMATGTISTSNNYTAATINSNGGAGYHSMLSFYTRSSSGLTNFGSRVYWTSVFDTSTNYTGEINSATWTNNTNNLGNRTVVASNVTNYSRCTSAIGSNTTGWIGMFDASEVRKAVAASASAPVWTEPSNIVIAQLPETNEGQAVNRLGFEQAADSVHGSLLVLPNLRAYATYIINYLNGTDWQLFLGTIDFSLGSGAATMIPIISFPKGIPYDGLQYPQVPSLFMLNDNNYVGYYCVNPFTKTIETFIISGTQVVFTRSVPAAHFGWGNITGTNWYLVQNAGCFPMSELGTYYSGSTF